MADTEFNNTVQIDVEDALLVGDLIVPRGAEGLVVFSHGSGSSRLSSRNRYVARHLQEAGFATLLFDLLTPEEDKTYSNRFDIDLLTKRLVSTIRWLKKYSLTSSLPIGLFGASTGAASAIGAATIIGNTVQAVVSRGGRPDLAPTPFQELKTPTLLIVGSRDEPVIGMNRQAYDQMHCVKDIEIVPNATHLFEEPGTLEIVAELAASWFKKHLHHKMQPVR